MVKLNLAHAAMYNGDIDQAKAIYAKYKTQNVTDQLSWTDAVKSDFETFKKNGLPNDNFDGILALFK